MRIPTIPVCAALVAALSATGAIGAPSESQISYHAASLPDWAALPKAKDVLKTFNNRPPISGRATMMCTVDAAGRLGDCQADFQSPQGMGFGDALLQMAPIFRMRPLTLEGIPMGGAMIRVPLVFASPSGDAVPPPGPPPAPFIRPPVQSGPVTAALGQIMPSDGTYIPLPTAGPGLKDFADSYLRLPQTGSDGAQREVWIVDVWRIPAPWSEGQLAYSIAHENLDCSKRRTQILEGGLFGMNGEPLTTVTKPGVWRALPDGPGPDRLLSLACTDIKGNGMLTGLSAVISNTPGG